MEFFPVGKVFDFMRYRRTFVGVSAVLVLGSLLLLFKPGPKLGTDFRGGTEIEVAFKAEVTADEIRKGVVAAGFSTPDVIRVDDESNPFRFMVRVQEVTTIDDTKRAEIEAALCLVEQATPECPAERLAREVKVSPGGDKITVRLVGPPDLERLRKAVVGIEGITLRAGANNPSLQNVREHKVEVQLQSKGDQLMNGLKTALGAERVPDDPLRVEWVGPKAGKLLRDAALKSIAIALVFIMIYIAFRFDLRFAPGAVVALAHDALVTIGVLTVLEKELSLSTVAAILTIVGYSVNDTVVVFDRVRENLGKLRGVSFSQIINVSLSEMLSRTILTSGTTIISLLAFFVWGTGTLKEFAMTLIIGMVLGTYSSIYVALPLVAFLDRKVFSKVAAKRGAKAAAAT